MFIAIVDFAVAPHDRDTALAIILARAATVHAMKGNQTFQAYLDPVDTGAIRIFHEWEDASKFEDYISSEAFDTQRRLLRPLMTVPPVSRRMIADTLETVR
jgi:quinol monooxygenase YgiN